MIIAIWIVAVLLLGLWTLAAWGLSSLLASDGSWIAGVKPWLGRMPFADVLENWIPTWQEQALRAIELLQAALQWLGSAGPVLVWGLWGLGTLVLLITAALLALLVALLRRSLPPPAPPPAPPAVQA